MVIGKGSATETLTGDQVHGLCREALERLPLDGKRILALLPDRSRTAPVDLMFKTVYRLLADRASALDFMIALGTHPPMADAEINAMVGVTGEERSTRYGKARFFNHAWDDPDRLVTIGTLSGEVMADLSGGLVRQEVEITLNRRVLDYDLVMIIGPVFPHEVVGFSGGNKYLFPGVSGREIIDAFHWLGALITNPGIIGKKHTPVRAVVDRAAAMVPVERFCMSLVVGDSGLSGLFIGTPEEAWSAAADLSRELHIVYKDQPFHTVLSCGPPMYEDLWTGAKCMYKLEPVVADGGELIIHAPHIREASRVHGPVIEKIGYHVRDYFLAQMDRFREVPGGVLAHATHVKGIGTFEGGKERPRIRVVLATGIPEETCRKINLGYRDPGTIEKEDYKGREGEGILFVPRAGERLYRLKNDPF